MEEEFVGELQKIDPQRIINHQEPSDLDNFFLTLSGMHFYLPYRYPSYENRRFRKCFSPLRLLAATSFH